MDIVERPALPPGYCIATLASEDPKGFIDTGLTPACVDPRVYVSVCWVEEMGRKLGMVDRTFLDEAHQRIKELEAQLNDADHLIQAAEVTLTHLQAAKKKPTKAQVR